MFDLVEIRVLREMNLRNRTVKVRVKANGLKALIHLSQIVLINSEVTRRKLLFLGKFRTNLRVCSGKKIKVMVLMPKTQK